jgi:hypothetical protein
VPVISVLMGAVAGFLGIVAATQAPTSVRFSGQLLRRPDRVRLHDHLCGANRAAAAPRARWAAEAGGQHVAAPLYASYAAITAAMAAVLIAMALTEHLQRDFYVSCVTLGVAVVAYLIVHRLRRRGWRRPAAA